MDSIVEHEITGRRWWSVFTRSEKLRSARRIRVGYDARHAIFRPGPHNAPPAGPNSAPPAVSALPNGCHGGAGAAALRLRPPARL